MNLIELKPRKCECCNNDDLEELYVLKKEVKTLNNNWEFNIKNTICKNCGFVFVSPTPTADSLSKYYSRQYAYYNTPSLDYDINKRIKFITRNLNNKSVFIEIGSNRQTEFQDNLKTIFSKVITVELNKNVESDFKSIDDIPENSADMLAHYFVLEHVPNVNEFLTKCYKILKPDGIMIIEVPDIRYYTDDFNALTNWEHVNHFSVKVLVKIAKLMGFELLDLSLSFCSRNFGFAAAFRKNPKNKNQKSFLPDRDEYEYLQNKLFFNNCLKKIKEFELKLQNVYQKVRYIDDNNEKTILWGANYSLINFLDNKELLKNTKIIDSNPKKKGFLDKYDVFQPNEAVDHIKDSKIIVIFTLPVHAIDILNHIKTKCDKTFNEDEIIMLFDFD